MIISAITAFSAGHTGNISSNHYAMANSEPLLSMASSNSSDSYSISSVPKILPKEGSREPEVLAKAPSCKIVVNGQVQNAIIVVDLNNFTLYKYDRSGNPEIAYSIAKGAPSSPTSTGIRRISHVEVSPYSTAPESTKRHRNPKPYGKRVIVLDNVDPKTGEISSIGEFIHGNGDNDTSMGQAVSGGCMRLPNVAVIELAKQVKRGDYVLIQ